MAKQSIKQKLEDTVMCSQISRKRDGTKHFIFRKGYFYTNGSDSAKFAEHVTRRLEAAGIEHTIIDNGDHWAAFKGGASVAKQSHWWVEVAVAE